MALKILKAYTSRDAARGHNNTTDWPQPTNETEARQWLQVQHDQTVDYINDFLNHYVDTGTSNHIVITPDPAFTSYNDNMAFYVKAANACTGSCDINVNGLGAKTIKKDYNVNLNSGDLLKDQMVLLKFDGTYFQAIGSLGKADTSTLSTHIADFNNHVGEAITSVGTSTWTNVDGTQSITGLGFQPKKVTILANVNATKITSNGFKSTYQPNGYCMYSDTSGNVRAGGRTIQLVDIVSTNELRGTITMTADGFDITWTKLGTGVTGTIEFSYACDFHG